MQANLDENIDLRLGREPWKNCAPDVVDVVKFISQRLKQ
jgi:hypothetical protein